MSFTQQRCHFWASLFNRANYQLTWPRSSNTGVGEILSQWSASDGKLHSCAFFSWRLSPVERNYNVGNRELLTLVIALQEWRPWLEGSTKPFIIRTEHKNLAYLRRAKRLNFQQARWALFLARFNFVLTY